jgi:hypothetical protein
MFRSILTAALIVLFTLIAGCSSHTSPLTVPSADPEALQTTIPESNTFHTMWGYWLGEYNTISGDIFLVPARTSQTHINVVGTLNKSMGISVVVDKDASSIPAGYIQATVSLTHPFNGQLNFSGFDVKGIFISSGNETPSGIYVPNFGDSRLTEPDGYTRWWNPVEFMDSGLFGYTPGIYGRTPPSGTELNSNINGYKLFADGLYETQPTDILLTISPSAPTGRAVFAAGNTNSRLYKIQFPVIGSKPVVYFNYAVDANWAPPSQKPPKIPIDFPIIANSPEPFIVKPVVTGSSLYTIDGTSQGGGAIDLSIDIWDWQAMYTGFGNQVGPLVLVSEDAEFSEGIVPDVNDKGLGHAVITAHVPGVPTKTGSIEVWIGITSPGTTYKQTGASAPDIPVEAWTRVNVDVESAPCVDIGNNDCDTSLPTGGDDSKDGFLCLDVDPADWFSFKIGDTETGNGTISLDTLGVADIDLYLWIDCPGTLVDSSTSAGILNEQINLIDIDPGNYFIEVRCADDGNPQPRPYILTTDISGIGTACTTDNDNNYSQAESVEPDDTDSDSVCVADDPADWYSFVISPGGVAWGEITLENKSFADNNMYVYNDPLDSPIFSGTNTGTDDETITIPALSPGVYYVKVLAMDTTPVGDRPFTLNMALNESTVDCGSNDGNNTPETAEFIPLFGGNGGTVCHPNDPDWYYFEAMEDGVSGFIQAITFGQADVNMYLYSDPGADPIESSANPGNGDEVIEVTALKKGLYYIQIQAATDDPGNDLPYGLATSLQVSIPHATDLWIHAHIVRSDNGTNPATTVPYVQADIIWADKFYGIYTQATIHTADITYINKTSWLACTTSEADAMAAQYGSNDGCVNVFYVDSTPDMPGAAAYANMHCRYENQTHDFTYVIINDFGNQATMAHELGHAAGLLADTYLLDFTDCKELTWCWVPPSNIFCQAGDGSYGNLMYWPFGDGVEDYWLSTGDFDMTTSPINSQAENIHFMHVNYPYNFHEPG